MILPTSFASVEGSLLWATSHVAVHYNVAPCDIHILSTLQRSDTQIINASDMHLISLACENEFHGKIVMGLYKAKKGFHWHFAF